MASNWNWSAARRRRFEKRAAVRLGQEDVDLEHCWADEFGTDQQRCQTCGCLSGWPISRRRCGTSKWRTNSTQPREWLTPHSVRTASRGGVSLVELWDREGVRLLYRPKVDDGLRRGVYGIGNT